MNFFTRGIRNTFRNGIRTFSIILILGLSIGLCIIMLIARDAVNKKIVEAKSSVGNSITVRPAGINGFEGGGSLLTTSQLAPISSIPHVTGVIEILTDRLSSSNTNLVSSITAGSFGRRQANISNQSFGGGGSQGRFGGSFDPSTFTPPITMTGVNKLNNLNTVLGATSATLTSGKLIDANSSTYTALVGSDLATKNNLKVGSTFNAYSQTFTVVGIFNSPNNQFVNSGLIAPITTVQNLSTQTDQVSNAIVGVDSIDNLDSTTNAISQKLGSAADVVNSQTQLTNAISPLKSVSSLSLICSIGAAIASSFIILLIMVMIVRERRREIGVYKAIGASNITVMAQFASEAVTFTLLASLVGLVIGVLGSNPITTLLVSNSNSTAPAGGGFGRRVFGEFGANNLRQVHAAVGWNILIYGLLVSVLIALVGSLLSSFMIAKIRPAEVMRAE
jgi:putative ABC transport system permease protein